MKAALSQTAFCGAVHKHGNYNNRLLADLDCNGWPQTGRNKALTLLRAARSYPPLWGYSTFLSLSNTASKATATDIMRSSSALVNTIYGRWWHPLDEKPGGGAKIKSSLPWVGDYEDGLGNKITMMAYANPVDRKDPLKRSDGYGIARFNKKTSQTTFECWPRFSDVSKGDSEQFEGWLPITIDMARMTAANPPATSRKSNSPQKTPLSNSPTQSPASSSTATAPAAKPSAPLSSLVASTPSRPALIKLTKCCSRMQPPSNPAAEAIIKLSCQIRGQVSGIHIPGRSH